jgi:hypothetical protein
VQCPARSRRSAIPVRLGMAEWAGKKYRADPEGETLHARFFGMPFVSNGLRRIARPVAFKLHEHEIVGKPEN